jgi:hypothetical protein
MNLLIKNMPALIGDFLGVAPSLIQFSNYNDVFVDNADNLNGLTDLLPIKIFQNQEIHKTIFVDMDSAFKRASQYNWYMTQAFMDNLGMPVPSIPPKAKLIFDKEEVESYDYLLSPFSRCLPESDKLPVHVWQDFVNKFPAKYALLGNSKFDDPNFIQGVTPVFDLPFSKVCNLYEKCKALISVVTGTSHLAFHLGTKNILLVNQNMTWGTNPDALCIRKRILTIKAEDIIQITSSL